MERLAIALGSFCLAAAIAAGCDVGTVAPAPDAGPSAGASSGAPPANGGSAGASGGMEGGATAGGGTGGDGEAGSIGAGGLPDLGEGPIGWASVPALGLDGTTGGEDGDVWNVSDFAELARGVRDAVPRTLYVYGRLSGRLEVGSNKTIIGVGGAVLEGEIELGGSVNVILRNFAVVGGNCDGDPECRSGPDAVNVSGGAHHVWIDHMDISNGSDGNLDITQGSDYVTVSWTKFWYSSTSRGHRFSNLIGAGDNVPSDEGKLKVTFHHNWWADNVDQRMPRTRYGLIHVFNNLYSSAGNSYCINAGMEAKLLVEHNVFRGVDSPHELSSTGNLLAVGNVYEATTGDQEQTGTAFEPPYEYVLEPTEDLAEAIMQGAGPR